MDRHPKTWAAGLAHDFGEAVVARGCAELITGSEVSVTPPARDELVSRLGGGPGTYVVDREHEGNPLPDY